MAKQIIQEHITFEHNKWLPALFGAQNAHLNLIADGLGVDLTSRGNDVLISGPQTQARQARALLELLWRRLEAGQDVDKPVVEAELRFLKDNPDPLTNTMTKKKSDIETLADAGVYIKTRKKTIQPRSPMQAAYMQAMRDYPVTFGLGPAGTGKTYLAVAMAVSLLEAGEIERIILSRPAVEAGENLGFLPGDLREKIDPYLRPLYDALYDVMAPEVVQRKIAAEEIEIAPLAFMRGRTLKNAFVILDEAQNTSAMQMKMFLTRAGENTRMVVTGDPSQTDLPKGMTAGLPEAQTILKGINDIAFIRLTHKDVMRRKLVAEIIQAYDRYEKS